MPRRVWTFLLCAGLLLPCALSRADEAKDLAALLERADVVARGFRGEFETFGGYDQPDAPLDFRTDDLRWKSKGRLWVKGDDALVELPRNPAAPPPEWNGPYNDIIQVLAASRAGTFDFQPTGPGHATLTTYTPAQPEWVRNRIDAEVLLPLNVFSTISGFPVESLLTSGDGVVRFDPSRGQYSVTAQHNDPKNPSTLIYDLTITDQTVRCSSKTTTGLPASAIIIETLAEGDNLNGTLTPRRVARRISAPAWGNLGPGERDVTREVVLFTPKDLEPAPFPITTDYFKKYEHAYTVTPGVTKHSRWPLNANWPTILALGALLLFAAAAAASGLVLWLRSRERRSTSKKPKGPLHDLL